MNSKRCDDNHRFRSDDVLSLNTQMKKKRILSRRKKSRSHISLIAVITVIIGTLVTVVSGDIKSRAVNLFSTSALLSSEEPDNKPLLNENSPASDMTVKGLFQPMQTNASFEMKEVLFEEDQSNVESDEKGTLRQYFYDPDSSGKTENMFRVKKFVIAEQVEDRKPVGVSDSFSSFTERVSCFLDARDISEDTIVSFIWYYGVEEIAMVNLPIRKGSRWRTHSSKSIQSLSGEWKVELRDVHGTVVESIAFMVD